MYSGRPKLSLFFSELELPSVEELRNESTPLRWKPCGGAFINGNNVVDREGNESHREKLLSVTAKDADVDDVLKVLHALQVTCQSRPLVETEELGKTFAKFLIALKNYIQCFMHLKGRNFQQSDYCGCATMDAEESLTG